MNEQKATKTVFGKLAIGCFWIVGIMATLAACGLVLLLLLFGSTDEERKQYNQEEIKREKALHVLQDTVKTFYGTHKAYPSHENIRRVENDALQDCLSSNTIRYYTKHDSTGGVCYVIEIITDVRTNWSGMRYSNLPGCIDLSGDTQPNSSGIYTNILDLH